mmetsp:Transcript_87865/g.246742  ORF Transcript_87865/g.246742 Transcript_87865/m.246742 type:complete len:146 (-) Transcript_87865:127-564(-)
MSLHLPVARSFLGRMRAAGVLFPGVARRWPVSPRRCIASSAPRFRMSAQFSDEQIEEISKHDAVLAQQIRTAKAHGVSMGWRELDRIPVSHIPQPSSTNSKKKASLDAQGQPLGIDGDGVSGLFKAVKDKLRWLSSARPDNKDSS